MSAYMVSMLLSNAMYHHLNTSTASELAESENSGNRKMFTLSLTPYGSSVWKARLGIRPVTVCEMWFCLVPQFPRLMHACDFNL